MIFDGGVKSIIVPIFGMVLATYLIENKFEKNKKSIKFACIMSIIRINRRNKTMIYNKNTSQKAIKFGKFYAVRYDYLGSKVHCITVDFRTLQQEIKG
jgi:hypothetical protein